MKGIHHISNFSLSREDFFKLEQLGALCIPGGNRIEIDQRLYLQNISKIEDILKQTGAKSIEYVHWTYTKEEVQKSEYCLIGYNSKSSCGYPQPEDFSYLRQVYDKMSWCNKCGMDKVQVDDFRVKKVSKHLLWGFFAWELDVLFIERGLYQELFKPLGVECRPLRYVSGKIRDEFVQLVIPVIDEDMDKSYILSEIECPECGRKKYRLKSEKPFFPLHKNPLPPIYMTKEYIGSSGIDADREIIISTELALELVRRKALKVQYLTPCHRNIKDVLKNLDY